MPTRETATSPRYPIRVVAERTGIAPATLRAWEKRHRAIAPRRSTGSQRLYSDADIERLRLIGELAAAGHPLADLARRSTVTLARMATALSTDAVSAVTAEGDADQSLQEFRAAATVTTLISETRTLDAAAVRATLTQAVFELGPLAALDGVFSPFLRAIGQNWECDVIGVAHEHLASTAVRDVLGWLLQNATHDRKAPAIIATTITAELHEFGVMMAAVVGALAGWRVIYLGPNTPARELVRVAKEARARVLLASMVTRDIRADVRGDFEELRAGLGSRTAIIAGGAAAPDHKLTLRRSGVELVENRAALRAALDSIWQRA